MHEELPADYVAGPDSGRERTLRHEPLIVALMEHTQYH